MLMLCRTPCRRDILMIEIIIEPHLKLKFTLLNLYSDHKSQGSKCPVAELDALQAPKHPCMWRIPFNKNTPESLLSESAC